MRRLVVIDRENISLVVKDAWGGTVHDLPYPDLEASRIWDLIGGLEGVEVMVHNCDVLIDLACYAQCWYPEAVVVTEQLRLHAQELRWHLNRLQGAAERGNLESAFPDYAQRAAATYYIMTRQLLALYESTDLPVTAELLSALR